MTPIRQEYVKGFHNIADHLGFALKIHKIKTSVSSTLKNSILTYSLMTMSIDDEEDEIAYGW